MPPVRHSRPDTDPGRDAALAAQERATREAEQRRRRWMGASAVLGFLLVVAVSVMVVIEVAHTGDDEAGPAPDVVGTATSGGSSPGPLPGIPTGDHVGALPDGPRVSREGKETWHGVGTPGAHAGSTGGKDGKDGEDSTEGVRTWSYVVEVEDGADTATFGGGDAFSATVDATLSDPRSWIAGWKVAFRHVSVHGPETPDLRIRLTTPTTTAQLCGSEIDLETSCFLGSGAVGGAGDTAGEGTVIINLARWVRGALPFAGDLGSYRQYVVNHEVGHGIGYARHQPCPSDGALAPVMMQQTLSLSNRDLARLDGEDGSYPDEQSTCRMNAWPHPEGSAAADR